jgi:hypothetical protein
MQYDWFNLGARPFGTGELEGAIDDFRVYGTALSPEQVKEAYAGTLRTVPAAKAEPAQPAPWPREAGGELIADALPAAGQSVSPPSFERGALSFWLEPQWKAGDRGQRVIFAQPGRPRPGGPHFRLLKPAGRAELRFELGDFRGAYTAARLDDTWQTPSRHHVAVAWSNDRGAQMWLDGLPAARPYLLGYDEVRWLPQAAGRLAFPPSDESGGKVSRLRVYQRPLTQREVWRDIGHDAAPLVRLQPSAVGADGPAPVLVVRNPSVQLIEGSVSWRVGARRGGQKLFLPAGKEVTLPLELPRDHPGRDLLSWRWDGPVSRAGRLVYHILPPGEAPTNMPVAQGVALLWTGPGEPKAPNWNQFEAAVAPPPSSDVGPLRALYIPWVIASGPRYNSWVEPTSGVEEEASLPPDFTDYLLARLARRGQKAIVGLEMTTFPSLQPEYLTPTASLAGGRDNPCNVLFRGKLLRFPQGGRQPTLNALHPKVWSRVEGLCAELLDRCAHSPAFAGLGFRLTPAFCGWCCDSQVSYDAWTLGEFARETGGRVPLDVGDPWQTSEAYRWLRANAWDAWIAWRARRLSAAYTTLADRVAQRRPGARLYVIIDASALPDWPQDAGEARTRLLEGGIDLPALKASPNVVVLER